MKFLKKMMQVGLAVFFFGLLATSTVFADDSDSEGWKFVQENGRTYYKKGDIKETAWRVIDGKTYFFDYMGEMVVGWQYIPMPDEGSTIGPYPNGIRLEYMPMSRWYYFNQDGVLQEFVGKQVLEAKTDTNIDKYHGEQYDSPAEKRVYYFKDQRSYHTLKTGWEYLGNKWYYLRSSGAMATGWYQEGSTWDYLDAQNGDMKTGWAYVGNKWYYLRSSGAMATGWLKDGSTWYYLHASNGDMKTGWFQVGGKWYYAYSSGALAVNTTVDGYYVNYNGEWVQ